MTRQDVARRRLFNQGIAAPAFERARDVVRWLGAVQAQDYLGALWAIGLRTRDATERDIEQAIVDRTIVRTWFMRGTLHFLPAEDYRWMLELTRPRMRAISRSMMQNRPSEPGEDALAASDGVLTEALRGGKQLTRAELAGALERAGIATAGMGLTNILHRGQTEGLICQAPRRGRQFTFTLLDEWLPPGRAMARDEALAEFAGRYFESHGPATLQDFVWWSGLTVTEARRGLEMAATRLANETLDGRTYWSSVSPTRGEDAAEPAYLLPNYDEYIVGYRDRSAVFDPPADPPENPRDNVVFNPTMVVDGQVVGTWKRTLNKGEVAVEASPLAPLGEAEARAVDAAVERYRRFLGLPAAPGK